MTNTPLDPAHRYSVQGIIAIIKEKSASSEESPPHTELPEEDHTEPTCKEPNREEEP